MPKPALALLVLVSHGLGAVVPPVTAQDPHAATGEAPPSAWGRERDRRAEWWSWRPVEAHEPPALPSSPAVATWKAWAREPIDRFVGARLAAEGLEPSPRAGRDVLLRRLSFALTGLPPSVEEMRAFVADRSETAVEAAVDRMLGSRAFAERWARHWMDWVRYADSHGSEGDPAIPYAWRYRDYLIRAFERDVGYDRMVLEAVAGDVMPEPRIDEDLGIVESTVGAAQLRFVQHGFAPTDALEEKVRFVDDQIDVVSKAFLGLTVSCARCHDHKFDAISQEDYYALFGVFGSTRPGIHAIDRPEDLRAFEAPLRAAKRELRGELVRAWRRDLRGGFAARLEDRVRSMPEEQRNEVRADPLHVLRPLLVAMEQEQEQEQAQAGADAHAVAAAFAGEQRRYRESLARLGRRPRKIPLEEWFVDGSGLVDADGAPYADAVAPAGSFSVLPAGERILDDILPRGLYPHLRSSRHAGYAATPAMRFDMERLVVRVAGDGGAKVRFVVEGYPRRGTVYPVHTARGGGPARFVHWDMTYWQGERGWVEASTAADQPVEVDTRAERSWFGVTDLYAAREGEEVRDEMAEHLQPLFAVDPTLPPTTVPAVLNRYRRAAERVVGRFGDGSMEDAGARFLGALVREHLLPTTLDELPGAREVVGRIRGLEARVPVARRVPGVRDVESCDQRLMVRGDHRELGDAVPRRFLESLDEAAYGASEPVRLQFGRDLVADDNPFTARVAVNRVWAVLFGRGLVATPDNFGRLGERPSHPELLDTLAADFRASGWSLRALIRRIVLSETFLQDGRARPEALARDPENQLWSRFGVRRLDAEAIRDAMLAVSGRLDRTAFGPPVGGGSPRRSVYVRVQRNDLDPFLRVFDFPAPHSTRGRRDATNVPAQALTLWNDPMVAENARAFAQLVLSAFGGREAEAVAAELVERAYGRPARPEEVATGVAFVAQVRAEGEALAAEAAALDASIERSRGDLEALRAPVRERLVREGRPSGRTGSRRPAAPAAAASWDFEDGVVEASSGAVGRLVGSARVEDGALVLDGRGHAVASLPDGLERLGARTLSAFVQLETLDQRGGAVVSVQTPGGRVFDAVVFGEKDPGQWLAGSDHFHRTESFAAARETEAMMRPVHVAIRWAADGTVTAFRDGAVYGRPYRKGEAPVVFGRDAEILFGLRHAPASPGRLLRGRVLAAAVHDRALAEEEVALLASQGPVFVNRRQVDEAMPPRDRERLRALEAELEALRAERERLGVPSRYAVVEADAWQAFAHGLFCSKEFLTQR